MVDEGGVKVVEGVPDEPFMSAVDDTGRLIEACLSNGVKAALLYAENLAGAFST